MRHIFITFFFFLNCFAVSNADILNIDEEPDKSTKNIKTDSLIETYHKQWNPEIQAKIDRDIEKNRKADAVINITGKKGKPINGATINVQQQTHEFLFGCNLFVLGQLDTPELNSKYENAFADLFNFATLPFYWADLEPEEGKPRFSKGSSFIWRRPPPDRLVKWCREHNIVPKGHALMYNRTRTMMPDWTERNNPEIFLKQAKKHMTEIAKRYKDDILVWDVVNEERYRRLEPESGHKVPDDYLPWCFRVAGELFPDNVKLLYNDDTQNHDDPEGYEGYINEILKEGLKIDGMGLQFHLFFLDARNKYLEGSIYPPVQLINFYNHLEEFGLPIYITEITVPGMGDSGPEIQAMIVKDLYRLWFSVPNMAGITWWNLGDGTAHGRENTSCAGLLDEDMNPKSAYQVLSELINNEWKTNAIVTADANGDARFRGFCGKYKVTIEYNGKTYVREINLSQKADNSFSVEL